MDLLFCFDTVSLCVVQTGLKLMDSPTSASQMLELKVCTTMPGDTPFLMENKLGFCEIQDPPYLFVQGLVEFLVPKLILLFSIGLKPIAPFLYWAASSKNF